MRVSQAVTINVYGNERWFKYTYDINTLNDRKPRKSERCHMLLNAKTITQMKRLLEPLGAFKKRREKTIASLWVISCDTHYQSKHSHNPLPQTESNVTDLHFMPTSILLTIRCFDSGEKQTITAKKKITNRLCISASSACSRNLS